MSDLERKGTVVSIEGMLGSGKSTIAKFLAWKYNLVRLESPLGKHFAQQRAFDESCNDVVERAVFYAKANDEVSQVAGEYLEKGKNVILENYCIPALAMDGLDADKRQALKGYFKTLLQPQMCFYIDIDYATMRQNTGRRIWDNRRSLANERVRDTESVFNDVREIYRENIIDFPHAIINGNCSMDTLKQNVDRQYKKFRSFGYVYRENGPKALRTLQK